MNFDMSNGQEVRLKDVSATANSLPEKVCFPSLKKSMTLFESQVNMQNIYSKLYHFAIQSHVSKYLLKLFLWLIIL